MEGAPARLESRGQIPRAGHGPANPGALSNLRRARREVQRARATEPQALPCFQWQRHRLPGQLRARDQRAHLLDVCVHCRRPPLPRVGPLALDVRWRAAATPTAAAAAERASSSAAAASAAAASPAAALAAAAAFALARPTAKSLATTSSAAATTSSAAAAAGHAAAAAAVANHTVPDAAFSDGLSTGTSRSFTCFAVSAARQRQPVAANA